MTTTTWMVAPGLTTMFMALLGAAAMGHPKRDRTRLSPGQAKICWAIIYVLMWGGITAVTCSTFTGDGVTQ